MMAFESSITNLPRRLRALLLCLVSVSLSSCTSLDCPSGSVKLGGRCLALVGGVECYNDKPCPGRYQAQSACGADYTCQYTCEEGFADCDKDLGTPTSNGCEASLSSIASCGTCGVSCPPSSNYCGDEGKCAPFKSLSAQSSSLSGVSTVGSTTDAQGNVYIAWSGYTASGVTQVRVTSFASDGKLRWEAWIGGYYLFASSIAVAPDGTVAVGGRYSGANVSIGTSVMSSRLSDAMTPQPTYDGFIYFMKGSDGTNAGVRTFEDVGLETVRAIRFGSDGTLTVAGSFNRGLKISGTQLTNTMDNRDSPTSDVFVARYQPNGSLIWAISFGGAQDDEATAIAVTDTEVLVGGTFDDKLASSRVPALVSHGSSDAFVLSLDATSAGTVWMQSLGGDGADFLAAVGVDATQVYAATTLFQRPVFTALSKGDGAAAWQWFPPGAFGTADEIVTTPSGVVLAAGRFTGSLVDDGTATFESIGSLNVFLARLRPDGGNVRWLRTFPAMYNVGGLTADDDRRVWLLGTFSGQVDFGTGVLGADGRSEQLLIYNFSE